LLNIILDAAGEIEACVVLFLDHGTNLATSLGQRRHIHKGAAQERGQTVHGGLLQMAGIAIERKIRVRLEVPDGVRPLESTIAMRFSKVMHHRICER